MRSNLLSLWKAFDHQIDNFMMKLSIFRPWIFVLRNVLMVCIMFIMCSFTSEMGICYAYPCFREPPNHDGLCSHIIVHLAPGTPSSGKMSVQWWWCLVCNVSETLFHYHCHPNCVLPFSGNHIQVLFSSVGCLSHSAADRLTAYLQPLGKSESQLSHALLFVFKIHT